MTPQDDSAGFSFGPARDADLGSRPYEDQFVLDTQIRIPFMRRYFERRRAERRARLLATLPRE